MRSLARDLRLAWRGLRRTPLFLASIILTLAIGVGANGAVFSILHAHLARLVMQHGLVPAAAGTVLGLGAAFAASTLLERLLFGVTPREPAVYLAVGGLIVLVTVLASLLPGRRAGHATPAALLRTE